GEEEAALWVERGKGVGRDEETRARRRGGVVGGVEESGPGEDECEGEGNFGRARVARGGGGKAEGGGGRRSGACREAGPPAEVAEEKEDRRRLKCRVEERQSLVVEPREHGRDRGEGQRQQERVLGMGPEGERIVEEPI